MIKRWHSTSKGEKKTRQITLLCKPSTYEAIQKAAYVSETSPNHLICEVLEKWIDKHQDLVDLYDKTEND